jgi:RNA polymerase-binding protein DksA
MKKTAKAAKPKAKAPARKPAPKPVKKAVKPAAAARPAKSVAAKKTAKPVRPVKAAKPAPVAPKGKPLAKAQLDHFRKKLLAEKQRVLEEMGDLTANTLKKSISDEAGENSRYSYHMGDVASLSYGREFSMGLAERQQQYLEQIDDALQRIDEGTYGICKVTGESIPVERLEEVPVAKYSVHGKEILDQQRRHSPDDRLRLAAEEQQRRLEFEEQQRQSGSEE